MVVEEKVDGANVGLAVGPAGELVTWNRNTIVSARNHAPPQFEALWPWLARRRDRLCDTLGSELVIFGEWCFAVHSVHYARLPDWWLLFDVWDRQHGHFWSTTRRDALAIELGMHTVPVVARGRLGFDDLKKLLEQPSRVGGTSVEGLYVRADDGPALRARAKLVRREFTQAIDAHWSRQRLRKNALSGSA